MKRALVTGGSGVIGAAICRRLASSGMHVVIHANHNRNAARALVDDLLEADYSAEVIAFDVTDGDATRVALEMLLEAGPIQVLVNNAGIHDDAPLPDMKAEQWRRVLAVSLDGYYNVTQPLLMAMMRTRWGRIINLSSVSGIIGNRGQSNYAAAKSGLIGATKSLSHELASRGITVNAVAPGIIESPMTRTAFPTERIKALVPMKRAGTPDEVAALVAFLTTDQAGYISGQCISINGGMA